MAAPARLPGVWAWSSIWIVSPAEPAGAATTMRAGPVAKKRFGFTTWSMLAVRCSGPSCGLYCGLRHSGSGPSRVGVLIMCAVCPGGPSCGRGIPSQHGRWLGGGGISPVGVNMRFISYPGGGPQDGAYSGGGGPSARGVSIRFTVCFGGGLHNCAATGCDCTAGTAAGLGRASGLGVYSGGGGPSGLGVNIRFIVKLGGGTGGASPLVCEPAGVEHSGACTGGGPAPELPVGVSIDM